MRLLGSEEEAMGRPGEHVDVARLKALAADWYGDRLDPAWRPRSLEASQAILARHGLTSAFWRLAG